MNLHMCLECNFCLKRYIFYVVKVSDGGDHCILIVLKQQSKAKIIKCDRFSTTIRNVIGYQVQNSRNKHFVFDRTCLDCL